METHVKEVAVYPPGQRGHWLNNTRGPRWHLEQNGLLAEPAQVPDPQTREI